MALFSIGHSTLPAPEFVRLLVIHSIGVLVDVRSRPFSRWNPQFNRHKLAATLTAAGIVYEWRGEHLGGLGDTPTDSPQFIAGMDELIGTAKKQNVAIMCAERLPQDCHRQTKLGTWAARERGVTLNHIVPATAPTKVQEAQRGLFD